MDFRSMVNNALRTPDQIAQEKARAEEQARLAQYKRAAEYIYGRIKTAILNKAQNGKATNSTITGTASIPWEGGYDDNIPYGNIFNAKYQTSGGRSNGFLTLYYKDTYRQSLSIQDITTLRQVFDMVRMYCNSDDIKISEPFILCEILDWNTKHVKEVKQFLIRNNTLSASVTTTKRGSGYKWDGETAIFSLAVDYSFSL